MLLFIYIYFGGAGGGGGGMDGWGNKVYYGQCESGEFSPYNTGSQRGLGLQGPPPLGP